MDYETIIGLIRQECRRQDISVYRLSQISEIPLSTLYGIFRDSNKAQLDTICQMLEALGLQLKVAAKEPKAEGFRVEMEKLNIGDLSEEQKAAVKKLVQWIRE